MKSLVSLYKEIGKGSKLIMARKATPILKDTHPPIWQTPGKLQFYKAEMEPYVPGKMNGFC